MNGIILWGHKNVKTSDEPNFNIWNTNERTEVCQLRDVFSTDKCELP
jgi:hypothetical protein